MRVYYDGAKLLGELRREIGAPGQQRYGVTGDGSMTNPKCQSLCLQKGFKYAGTEYSSECFCGNSLSAEKAAESNCNYKCEGNYQEICGGYWHISIHRR